MIRQLKALALMLVVCSIAACSGGGGGGGGNSATTSSTSSTSGSTTPTNTGTSTSSGSNPTTPIASSHTLQLSWALPTTRENGTALTASELSGYQIYYYKDGSSSGAGEVVNVSGGSTTNAQVTVNGDGTFYFAIAARDTSGLLSNLSSYVAVNLN